MLLQFSMLLGNFLCLCRFLANAYSNCTYLVQALESGFPATVDFAYYLFTLNTTMSRIPVLLSNVVDGEFPAADVSSVGCRSAIIKV